jgi:hypothetical protein
MSKLSLVDTIAVGGNWNFSMAVRAAAHGSGTSCHRFTGILVETH